MYENRYFYIKERIHSNESHSIFAIMQPPFIDFPHNNKITHTKSANGNIAFQTKHLILDSTYLSDRSEKRTG